MKRISLAVVILMTGLAAMAQDNKPVAGNIGIGYGVSFFPTAQHVNITYMATNNIEVGGTIGFQYTRTRNSTFDSLYVTGTGFTNLFANEEHRMVTTTANVFITPLVKYHFNVKSNLDVYAGANLPIGVGTGPVTVTSDIITATSYNNTGTVTVTPPVSVTVGAGALLGCQYFFYKNLCVGAEANLGFSGTINNGYTVTKASETNTGSNNGATGTPIPTITSRQMSKSDTESLGMLHTFSLSASWYFGKAK